MFNFYLRFKNLEKEFSKTNFENLKPKLKKAKNMAKDQPNVFFRVENDGGTLLGVVKSQTNINLIYASYLRSDGTFGCQTQNLNACGGLRGHICKHILTLVVSASQNRIIMNRFVDWLQNSSEHRPTNDRQISAYIFEQYEERMNVHVLGINVRTTFQPIHHANNFPLPSTITIIDALVEGEVSIKANGALENISTTVKSIGTGEKKELDKAIELGWLACTGCDQWYTPEEQEAFKEGTDCLSAQLGLAKVHTIIFN